nr:MAG TPA: hypothetical protein [Caudoviricetes sp.]
MTTHLTPISSVSNCASSFRFPERSASVRKTRVHGSF